MGKRVFVRINIPTGPTQTQTREALDLFMGKAFRFAVREAIHQHIDKIHILSGMARGTFLYISRFVRAGVNFPTNPGFKYYHNKGSAAQNKSALLGASYSTARSREAAAARFTQASPRYTFEMQTSLKYFGIEDSVRWDFSEPFTETIEAKLTEYLKKNGPTLLGSLFSSTTRGRGNV